MRPPGFCISAAALMGIPLGKAYNFAASHRKKSYKFPAKPWIYLQTSELIDLFARAIRFSAAESGFPQS